MKPVSEGRVIRHDLPLVGRIALNHSSSRYDVHFATTSRVYRSDLSGELVCPRCGNNLILNAFVLDHNWRSLAAQALIQKRPT